jgi:hypothetical protein
MSHNTQLHRTVKRHHVRAASAALPLCARGRRTCAALHTASVPPLNCGVMRQVERVIPW